MKVYTLITHIMFKISHMFIFNCALYINVLTDWEFCDNSWFVIIVNHTNSNCMPEEKYTTLVKLIFASPFSDRMYRHTHTFVQLRLFLFIAGTST